MPGNRLSSFPRGNTPKALEMLQADPQVVLGVRTPSMLSARPAVRGEWICVRLGTLNALGSGDPLWCGVGAPENRRRQRQQDSWCEQPYCPTIRIGLMTRRSIERDCAKSLPDAEPDSIRLNTPEFSGRRSVRRRHCLEAASLVSRNGYAPDKRGSPPRPSPCCLLISAPASAGKLIPPLPPTSKT